MFTGIIGATGKVRSVKRRDGISRVEIEKPKSWAFATGASIAVDGICSTVVEAGRDAFAVDYMPETLRKTTARIFAKGVRLNLERPLTLKAPLDGHLVQGHVDGRGKVTRVARRGGECLVTILVPKPCARFVAALGSIAVNGVSLTVARKKGSEATIALIPHTLAHTNLGTLRRGDLVNIEVDLVARYILNTR